MAMIDFPPLTRSRDLDCKYIQMNERKQFLGKLTFTHWSEEDHFYIAHFAIDVFRRDAIAP